MYVCKDCGSMHAEPGAICCGAVVAPLEEALGFQNKLFELAGNDRAQNVLRKLTGDYEAAAQAVRKAVKKLGELQLAQGEAAETLLDFYKLSVESGDRS